MVKLFTQNAYIPVYQDDFGTIPSGKVLKHVMYIIENVFEKSIEEYLEFTSDESEIKKIMDLEYFKLKRAEYLPEESIEADYIVFEVELVDNLKNMITFLTQFEYDEDREEYLAPSYYSNDDFYVYNVYIKEYIDKLLNKKTEVM